MLAVQVLDGPRGDLVFLVLHVKVGPDIDSASNLMLQFFDVLSVEPDQRLDDGRVAFDEEGVSSLLGLAPHIALDPERNRLLAGYPANAFAHRASLRDLLRDGF